MTLVLNEDQLMFRDAARRFATERAPVSELRRLRDTSDATGFDRAVWKEMADMGWAGVLVPEEYGGVGFGHVGAGLIAQEIGRNLSATPLLSTAVLGVTALVAATALWNHWCGELLELHPEPDVHAISQIILGGDSPRAARRGAALSALTGGVLSRWRAARAGRARRSHPSRPPRAAGDRGSRTAR